MIVYEQYDGEDDEREEGESDVECLSSQEVVYSAMVIHPLQ